MMHIAINTTLSLPSALAVEFVSMAVSGGSGSWADITEVRRDMAHYPRYASARFTERAGGINAVISKDEIAIGIQRVLADLERVPLKVREKILRALVNQDASGVDVEMADYVVRAVVCPAGLAGQTDVNAPE
jgi:hypothetical protein